MQCNSSLACGMLNVVFMEFYSLCVLLMYFTQCHTFALKHLHLHLHLFRSKNNNKYNKVTKEQDNQAYGML